MRRLVARFLIGAIVLLALYESVQALVHTDDLEAGDGVFELEVELIAVVAQQRISQSLAADPPPKDAGELSTALGVGARPVTKSAHARVCAAADFTASADGLHTCVRVTEDGIQVLVAGPPFGPVELDSEPLLEHEDDIIGPGHYLSAGFLVLGMLVLGVGLAWSPVRQLEHLADTARRLQSGQLSARASATSGGLAEPVALAFNDMADQLQQTVEWQEALLQTVAHEVRTPLSRVRFVATRVEDAEDGIERSHALADLDRELEHFEDTVSSVLSLLRADKQQPLATKATKLGELLEAQLNTWEQRLQHRRPPLAIERIGLEAPLPPAWVDRAAVKSVFENLLHNAAAHAESRVRVTVAHADGLLQVSVEDDGDGVPASELTRIFEPFVHAGDRPQRAGVGLGLAIVKHLAEAHGQPVVAGRSELGGLRVQTRWPVSRQPKSDTAVTQ